VQARLGVESGRAFTEGEMMDARAEAKIVLGRPSTGHAWAKEPGRLIPAACKVAKAYLAEHPDDDGERHCPHCGKVIEKRNGPES
jgi:alpha-D-ribose 1-methylphosphonate 5-triphosphate synthase subunit PhnG